MVKKLRRFQFSGLEKVSRERLTLTRTLARNLPATPFEAGFKEQLRSALEPYVHVDVDFWLEGIQRVDPGTLVKSLGRPFCVAVVALPPSDMKMLIEIDLTCAQKAVDRMLGGDATDVDGQRALSSVEEGVLSFLLLQALRVAQAGVTGTEGLGLSLRGVVNTRQDLDRMVSVDDTWVAIRFRLFFDVDVSYARLILPASLLAHPVAGAGPWAGPALDRALGRVRAGLPRVANLRVPLWVELGRLNLTLADVRALDPEDIVLLESAEVTLKDGRVDGPVSCRTGGGRSGRIQGRVHVGESGRYEVTIDEISNVGEPPILGRLLAPDVATAAEDSQFVPTGLDDQKHAAAVRASLLRRPSTAPFGRRSARAEEGEMDEEYSGSDDSDDVEDLPLPEAAGLLDDVNVDMVIELGRVKVSAADVVGLRPGQVIELNRAPGDPVDLVVDGRRIGKGELVEIEGELGVRVLSMAK